MHDFGRLYSPARRDPVDLAADENSCCSTWSPRSTVPDADVRAWRSLIQLRQRLLGQRVMVKNQIRAVLREHDLAGAKWLWSKKQITWLELLDLHPSAKLRRSALAPRPRLAGSQGGRRIAR